MPLPRPQFIELASVSESGRVQSIVTHRSPPPSAHFYKLLKYNTLSRCHLWLQTVHPLSYLRPLKTLHLFADGFLYYVSSFLFRLCRTHLSWSVCPCPSPRERAWHVSVLVKTTVERRATSPCKHPLHHRPPAVLLTNTWHRRERGKEKGARGLRKRQQTGEERTRGTLGEPWDVWALFPPAGTVCCCVALGTFKRGLGRERPTVERGRKKIWTSVKCPVLNFYGTKTYLFFFYFQLQSLFPFFFSDVFVNGHLYVNMKKRKNKIKYW